ncbi:MAG: hypothetical protein RL708_356 [Bacteroidota bacterium]|jgi:hypothetical protein
MTIYPSVEAEYEDCNLAINPTLVNEKKIILESITSFSILNPAQHIDENFFKENCKCLCEGKNINGIINWN